MEEEPLEPLKPIIEIVGRNGVTASYSQHKFYGRDSYRPGWEVDVKATVGGGRISISHTCPTLAEAAERALTELKSALGR